MKKVFTIALVVSAFLMAETAIEAQTLKNLLKKATSEVTTVENVSAATSNGKQAGAISKSRFCLVCCEL